jgi:hypothetical protein
MNKEQLTIRILKITSCEYIENEYGKTFLPNEFLDEIPYEFVLQKGVFC